MQMKKEEYGNKEEPAQGIPQVQYEGDINADSSLNKILYSILKSSRNRMYQKTKDAVATYSRNGRMQTAMGTLMEKYYQAVMPGVSAR